MHGKRAHARKQTKPRTCVRVQPRDHKVQQKGRKRSMISLPFHKSATWAIKGKMSEQNQKRVLLFIALES